MKFIKNPICSKIHHFTFACFACCLMGLILLSDPVYAQVKIGHLPDSIQSTSILELESNHLGLLLPRLTEAEALAMIKAADSNEADGLLIYNSSRRKINQFDTAGAGFWRNLDVEYHFWSLNGNRNTQSSDYLGTLDSTAIQLIADSTIHWKLLPGGRMEFLKTGYSVMIGELAGTKDNRQSNKNIFIGYKSGKNNQNGQLNTAIGAESFEDNEAGVSNTAIGYRSLNKNTADYNSALGRSSLEANTTGTNNSAIGYTALYSNTSGTENSALGSSALRNNTTGVRNSAIGMSSLLKNTTGYYNTALGWNSLKFNTSGKLNTAVGAEAMINSVNGDYNTAVGNQSLYDNTSGSYSSSLGYRSLNNHSEGDYNTACGAFALFEDSIGVQNTALGGRSMYLNDSGDHNVAIGFESMYRTKGSRNVAIGYQAGYFETGSDKLYIDNTSTTSPLIYGDFNTNDLVINGDLAYTGSLTSISDKRLKRDVQPLKDCLPQLKSLHTYTYHYSEDNLYDLVLSNERQIGLMAQEVEQIFPLLVKEDVRGVKSIDYLKFVPLLIHSIQELSNKVELLEQELEALRNQ